MDFSEELDKIQDEEIRQLTKECLDNAPPHFWYRPASSTGKYHAPEENEEGGLIIHTKRVCHVGELLIAGWVDNVNADVIRSACILHDVCKYGEGYSASRYTLNNHPALGARFIRAITNGKYDIQKVDAIANAVASHMGKWGSSFINEPENLIVHLADLLATGIYMKGVANEK
jgi:23S rRNA maturation-related 3'-5' exoribonuclease YhaM